MKKYQFFITMSLIVLTFFGFVKLSKEESLVIIEVIGTRGDHSGAGIDRTGSALKLLIDCLLSADDLRIVSLSTSNIRGTIIPSDGKARILVPKSAVEKIKRVASEIYSEACSNPFYIDVDDPSARKKFKISVFDTTNGNNLIALNEESSKRVLSFLAKFPTGSQAKENGDVILSSNLASIKLEPGSDILFVLASTRYNDSSLIEPHKLKLERFVVVGGGKIEHKLSNTFWQATTNPKQDELLNFAQAGYKTAGGEGELISQKTHGGLEPQVILTYCRPGTTAICLGANIINAHTENERLELSSVKVLYGTAAEMAQSLSKVQAGNLKQHYAEQGERAIKLFIEEICRVPRPSNNPKQIVAYMESFAKSHGLNYLHDEAGNVFIWTQGTCSKQTPFIVFQGHSDMVIVGKNADNVLNVGVEVIREKEFIRADNSSLGADNGIGLAVGLTLLTDSQICHGPLGLLITTGEEDGFTGAKKLGTNLQKMLHDTNTLINLDGFSTKDGVIGSAGYIAHSIKLPVRHSR